MKTKVELEQDILYIITKVHLEFPELSKYIAAMPEKNSVRISAPMSSKSFKEFYSRLEVILSEYTKKYLFKNSKVDSKAPNLPGYLPYPKSDDIYSRGIKEMDLNPEDLSKSKSPNEVEVAANEQDFQDDRSGNDLDVPGSELDDQQESIGSEDEENNYYSIGGDNHNDLEEAKE